MLGKLVRHEWKSTYRMGCLMLGITLLVTFLGWLSFQSPLWRQMGEDTYRIAYSPLDFLSIVMLLMYFFMLVGVSYALLIYLGIHFYRTMYTDQGYLTHTLPVGAHHLLCSKLLVGGLWILIVDAGVVLSIMAVLGTLFGRFVPDEYTLHAAWRELVPFLREFFTLFGLDYGFYLVLLILSAVVGPFVSAAILFGSITVGQIFSRARALMAILCYLGVGMANSLIATVVQSAAGYMAASYDVWMNVSMNASLIVQVIAAVLLYFASYHIITKKLNME